ncbi:MAG: isoquinoline 1-oxidoreductase beta subunit, partial [Candidatus Azotimanducaceae bacterium]
MVSVLKMRDAGLKLFRVSRRRLLIGGSGITAVAGASGLWLGLQKRNELLYRVSADRDGAFAPSVYLAIETTGKVTIWLTKSEMGQGVSTTLPMLVAEELEADWTKVSVEQAVTESAYNYGNQFTAASSSTSGEWIMLRRAGATAKEMLLSAASSRWGVDVSDCYANNGVVYSRDGLHQADFGSLAEDAAREWAPIRPSLKTPENFNLVGTSIPRIDSRDKSSGAAVYGMDVGMDNLRYAKLTRCPVFGGTLDSVDEGLARAVSGVTDVVKLQRGIAVVAENTWAAMQGSSKLTPRWSANSSVLDSSEGVAARLRHALERPDALLANGSDKASSKDTEPYLTCDYELPYLAHMCMEPMNCTVSVSQDRCDMWVPTQAPLGAQQVAARITGLPESKIFVNVTQLGGGFGRRASQDFVEEAVELALQVDGPVKLVWSREDDIKHGVYREASAHRLTAYASDSGLLSSAWIHRVVTANYGSEMQHQVPFTAVMGATDMPYSIAEHQVEWVGVAGPVPTGIWRSVGYSYNTFAVESFVDELAVAVGVDPVAYRLSLLANNASLVTCLERVAEMAQWGVDRRHLGVACLTFGQTQIAMIIEVK